MNINQRYLPRHQFAERHALPIKAAPAQVLDAVESLTRFDDLLIRSLMRLREAPARLAARLGWRSGISGRPLFGLHEFTRLERAGDHALAYGLVGRFWRPSYALESIQDAAQFLAYDRPGVAKLLLSFHCKPDGHGHTRLLTETQVYCPDRHSRLLFNAYWLLIRPASGLIRRRMLQLIRQRAEPAALSH